MPEQEELISKFIDRVSFQSDTKFAINELSKLESEYQKLQSFKLGLQGSTGIKEISANAAGAANSIKILNTEIANQTSIINNNVQAQIKQSKSIEQNIKDLNDNKAALVANNEQQKKAKKDVEAGAINADEYRKKLTDLTKAQFNYRAEISEITKQIKAKNDAEKSSPTSINKAQADNKILTTQRNALPTTNISEIAALNAQIDKNNALIDANSDKLLKQKINIGNYGPSVKTALLILEEELQKINTQLSTVDKNSDAFKKLQKESNLLKSVSGGLDKAFTSTKQELRALQEAAKQVGTQFGVASSQFSNFSNIVGDRKDEIDDIQKAINFKASDTKALDATVEAVQLVVGAYGAYEAAVALTGIENEELNKSMQKLQAVLTLVTSVQSIANALQTESALVQGALSAKSAFLAAANKLVALTTGETAVALTAESVAAGATIVAIEGLSVAQAQASTAGAGIIAASSGASVAMAAEGVSAGGLAVGLETVVVAEGAVAVGATSMATAIAATGIGLIIIGLAIGIYKIYDALKDWSNGNESVKQATDALNGAIKDTIEATKALDDLNKIVTDRELANIEKIIAKRRALGVTQAQDLALQEKSAIAKEKNAKLNINRGIGGKQLTPSSLQFELSGAKTQAELLKDLTKQRENYINNVKNNKDPEFKDQIKNFDERIKKQKEVSDLTTSNYKTNFDAYSAYEDAKNDVDIIRNQKIKLSQDDRRKFVLESARIEVDIATSKNDYILNNDRSTLKQQLSAINNNLLQKKKLLNAENNATQNDPMVSSTDKNISQKNTNANIGILEIENAKAIFNLKESFRLKDLAATTEIQNELLNIILKTNTAILDNEYITEAERLEALQKSLFARKNIIDANFKKELSTSGISDANIERIKNEGFFEIKNKSITNKELQASIIKYNNNIIQISEDTEKKKLEIVKDYAEKELNVIKEKNKSIERSYELANEDATDTYNNQIISFNNSLEKGEISNKKFNNKKLIADAEYAKKSILIEIDRIEKLLVANSNLKDTQKELQKELTGLQNFTGPQTDQQKELKDNRIEKIKKDLELIEEAVNKETDLYKGLSKAKRDLSDESKKKFTEDQQKNLDDIKEFAAKSNEILGVISSAFDAYSISKKNKLADEKDALDKKTSAEIESVAASTLSEEEKAAKIAIINARSVSQKEEITRKEKKIDQDKARFEKTLTIFRLTLALAEAIASFNAFKIVAAGLQLAVAVATPVPKFAKGKFNNYEGIAEVGDGGVHEYIKREGGAIEKTPARSTLTYLGKHDIVYPNLNAMMTAFAMPVVGKVSNSSNNNILHYEKIKDEIAKQTPLLNIIANKRENHISAKDGAMLSIWKHGANTTKYIEENTNW